MMAKLSRVGFAMLIIPVISITFAIFLLSLVAEVVDRIKVLTTSSKGGL